MAARGWSVQARSVGGRVAGCLERPSLQPLLEVGEGSVGGWWLAGWPFRRAILSPPATALRRSPQKAPTYVNARSQRARVSESLVPDLPYVLSCAES